MKGWHILVFIAVALAFVFMFRPPAPTAEHLEPFAHPTLGIVIKLPSTVQIQFTRDTMAIYFPADSTETRSMTIFRPHFPPDSLTPRNFPMSRDLNPDLHLQFGAWIEEDKSRRDYRHAGYWVHHQDTFFLDAHWQEDYFLFDGSKARKTEFSLYYLSTLSYYTFN